MPEGFKKLDIDDREVFNSIFTSSPPSISEYTFSNLFMWKNSREFEYMKFEEGIILKGIYHDAPAFFPPIGFNDCRKAFDFLFKLGYEKGVRQIKLIPEYQKKFVDLKKASVHPDRDNFDYVYKTESLALLKGWRLDGKRGFIKKFRENYEFEYKAYTGEYRELCLDFMKAWCAERMESDPGVKKELDAFTDFINNIEQLGAAGGLLFVDGKLAAFTFGEKLNDMTFVVHYEKADISYTGSYQIINQLFIQNEASGRYVYVNREQDMGIEGLRRAKSSYHPVRLIKKYSVLIN